MFISLFAVTAVLAPSASIAQSGDNLASAVFAGGCFWCMEPPFDALEGVVSTTSGYTGGDLVDPSYEQVSRGDTGHVEAVEVRYDPDVVSYDALLDVYWRNIDPTDAGGQFCDRGEQYRSAIFFRNEHERDAAVASRDAIERNPDLPDKVVTEILPAKTFYPAEDYHQNYYQENPLRYKFYRFTCGRDQRLTEVWGDSQKH